MNFFLNILARRKLICVANEEGSELIITSYFNGFHSNDGAKKEYPKKGAVWHD